MTGRIWRHAAFALGVVLAAAPVAHAQSIAGVWDAAVTVNRLEIPFRLEIAGQGANVKGSFFNGDERVTSTSGQFEKNALTLSFDEYGSKLDATFADGRLQGKYDRGTRGAPYPFSAKRFVPPPT